MKIKQTFVHLLLITLFFLFVFFVLNRFLPALSLRDFSFFRSEKISAYTVAEEIRDLYVLNTSEYRTKLIFPFDFVKRDFDWWIVKEIYEKDMPVPESLVSELSLYKTCLTSGFDPAVKPYNFIVLTAVIKAGIKISGTIFEDPENFSRLDAEKTIKIEEKGDERILSILIPDIEITEYYIEDRKPENDNFPDAFLTPGQWRDLVDFLYPLIQEKAVELGILENARINSELLIERILQDSGFSEVIFLGEDL